MGLQEVPCSHSAIFFMGLYKIKEYTERCQFILQNVIGQYVEGFDDENIDNWTWNNWNLLQRAIAPFTIQKQINQAGISKFFENSTFGASDGSKAPTRVISHHGACVHVYEALKDFDILKDPNAIKISYTNETDIPNENIQIWNSILTSYETILNTLESLYMIAYSITPMYYSPRQRMLSPYQVQLYKSDLMDIELLLDRNYISSEEAEEAAYHRIYWTFIDNIFPILIDNLRNKYWGEFIKANSVTPVLNTDIFFTYKHVESG